MRLAAAGLAAASALLVGACGEDTAGPERGADVEDVQEQAPPDVNVPAPGILPGNGELGASGTEDSDVTSYVGQQVTVSADVNKVISPAAFTIAGTENTTVDKLLVLHKQGGPPIVPGSTVQVTGTVRQGFTLPAAEQFLGTDLNGTVFAGWNDRNYIEASSIDTTMYEPDEAPS